MIGRKISIKYLLGHMHTMKLFTGILAFIVVFVPFAGFGVLATIGLWEGGKNPNGEPVLAVVVGVACACIGILAGSYSARATMKRYEQPKSDTVS